MYELLDDLMTEVGGQFDTIISILLPYTSTIPPHPPNPTTPLPSFSRISQLSHAIKGAMANLSCTPVREAAFELEEFAKDCSKRTLPPDGSGAAEARAAIVEAIRLKDKVAHELVRLKEELESKGVKLD